MCASRGTKFSLMKAAISSSAYDSASSRAHAPQAGAALKSISTGFFLDSASFSAASASFFHWTNMSLSSFEYPSIEPEVRIGSWQSLHLSSTSNFPNCFYSIAAGAIDLIVHVDGAADMIWDNCESLTNMVLVHRPADVQVTMLFG